jgi:ubiquinone/menaquinone biosynthesis C-methylase UbiE
MQIALWPFGRAGSRRGPLRRRLHAWWNGYDLNAPTARARAIPESGDGEPPHDGQPLPGRDPKALTTGWTDKRREVAEAVWTPGFIIPGGTNYVEELVNGCTLTAAETMLEINIGPGGGTRTIIARFGNYVTAYEREEALAREARSHAIVHDLDGKLDLKVGDYEEMEIKSSYFRAALVREALFVVEDKENMLRKVCNGLKDGESHLIITDLLFDADDDDPALQEWIAGEAGPVFPWSIDALRTALRKYKVNIRMEEDESERYCAMVTESWSNYLAGIRGKALEGDDGQQAMAEAAYWTRRVNALKSGALRYYVIKAIRST